MKKTLTRVLSLVLVLAMFVSAAPLALADNEVVKYDTFKISCPSEGIDNGYFDVPIGSTIALSGNGTPTDANETLKWTSDTTSVMSVEGNMLTVHSPGQSIIRVSDSDNNELANHAFRAKHFPTIASETLEVLKGQTATLPAVTIPSLEEDAYEVTWAVPQDNGYATVDGTSVTGVNAGTVTATATISDVNDLAFPTLTCEITVSEITTYTPAKEAASLELAYGSETALPGITGLDGLTPDTDYTIDWTSSNPDVLKVENSKLKALTVGTAKLTAAFSPKEGLTFNPVQLEWNVTVSAGITLEVKDFIEMQVDDTYTLKAPTLKGTGASDLTVVDYEYTRVADSTVNTVLTELPLVGFTLTGYRTGRDALTVTAVVKDKSNNEVKVPPLTVYASVYAVAPDITVVLKDSTTTFDFDDTTTFTSMTVGTTNVTNTYESLAELFANLNVEHVSDRSENEANYRMHFVSVTAEGGSLSDAKGLQDPQSRPFSMAALDRYRFTKNANKLAKSKFEYQIIDDEGLLIMTGVLYIDYKGTSQILYATDFETPVTFNENDFEAFWAEYGTGKLLNYITFDQLPYTTSGRLWTSENKTTAVTTSMKFISDYYGTSAFYDLDTVTFVPAVKTSAYTVSIPFTAVDMQNSKVTGTVTISVSKGTTSNVSSLGMAFGNSSYNLDDKIAEEFKKVNDGEILDYVTFTLPSVEYGKLYYNFNDLLTSELVYSSDKFYYNPGSSENVDNLAKVGFIPAAGCTGSVKISYTAVGESGTTYEGFVTLKVTAKSQSSYFTDVKSGSYNWASDSVDFLRYHGVVNGTTETTFGPGNNITRAHFMLMLYRAFLADDYKNFTVTSNFSDVTKGTTDYSKELYQAVGVAKYLGITNGSDGKYLPNRNITREEAMTLIYRTLDILDMNLKYNSDNKTSDFADYSKVSAYAKDPIKYLIEHGVVLGTDGKINPKSNITRAEMAVILHRVLTY